MTQIDLLVVYRSGTDFEILTAFGLGNTDKYNSYGHQVILSNEDILTGFKNTFGLTGTARDISKFLYVPSIKELWFVAAENTRTIIRKWRRRPISINLNLSIVEKHLEDFLIANWEKTDLGKRYDLIGEDGEPISQQFRYGSGNLLICWCATKSAKTMS